MAPGGQDVVPPRGSELVAVRAALHDVVGETRPHVVQGHVSGRRERKEDIPMLTECCDKHAAMAYTAGGENPLVGFARGAVDVTDERMREIAARMREAAMKVGRTSKLWDVVFDAEAILTGEVSWADRKMVERSLQEWARRSDWDRVA